MGIKLLTILSSCTAVAIANTTFFVVSERISTAQSESEKAYQDARIDAADPQPNEVLDNLTAIVESNPNLIWEGQPGKRRVVVATFTTTATYKEGEQIFPSPDGIWVTIAPELKDFCTNYKKTGVDNDQLNLRLKQLLGLPPNSDYTHIAEIWVHPQYLKRPTLDPEINDRTVQLPNPIQGSFPFPEGVDDAYQQWFKKLFNNRNTSPYPWTALGYTYDWDTVGEILLNI